MPVVAWQSVYMWRVRMEGGSGGAMSASAGAADVDSLMSMGMAGERACVVLVFMRAWSKWP
jgi:hypothetical protein